MIKSYFVDGDKGGVGKSFISRCLVDSFINHEVSGMPKIDKLIVIDADPMNPDVVCDSGYQSEVINPVSQNSCRISKPRMIRDKATHNETTKLLN